MVNVVCVTLCTSVILLITGLSLLLFHRQLIRSQIEKQSVLVKGQQVYNLWLEPPVPFYFRFFIFNITNPDWYTRPGEKLIVKEVGPYVFKETRTRKIIDESDDEITYIPISHFTFLEGESGGLKLMDPFTTVNIPLLTLLGLKGNSFTLPKVQMYPFIENFLKAFLKTNYTERVTVTKTVDELVLGGYEPEVFAKIATLAQQIGVKIPIPFEVLLGKNATEISGKWTVNTGKNEPSKLNQLHKWKGNDFLPQWQANSPCAKLSGGDGTIFPPGINEQSQLKVFSWEACRVMRFNFVNRTRVRGIETLRFAMDPIYESSKQVDTCYCLADRRRDCLSDGLVDISTCAFDSPIIVSKPHFLDVKDEMIDSIQGISKGDESIHHSFLDIEPWTGAPLNGQASLQINILFDSPPKYGLRLKKQIVPVLWFEARAQVNQEAAKKFNDQVFLPLNALQVTSITVVSISFTLPILLLIYLVTYKRKLLFYGRMRDAPQESTSS